VWQVDGQTPKRRLQGKQTPPRSSGAGEGQTKFRGTEVKDKSHDEASKKGATKKNEPDARTAKVNRGGKPPKIKSLQEYLLQTTKDYLKKVGVSQGLWRSSHHAGLKHKIQFWCNCAPETPMKGFTALQSWLISKEPLEKCTCKLCQDTLLRPDVKFKQAELLELYRQVTDFFQRGLYGYAVIGEQIDDEATFVVALTNAPRCLVKEEKANEASQSNVVEIAKEEEAKEATQSKFHENAKEKEAKEEFASKEGLNGTMASRLSSVPKTKEGLLSLIPFSDWADCEPIKNGSNKAVLCILCNTIIEFKTDKSHAYWKLRSHFFEDGSHVSKAMMKNKRVKAQTKKCEGWSLKKNPNTPTGSHPECMRRFATYQFTIPQREDGKVVTSKDIPTDHRDLPIVWKLEPKSNDVIAIHPKCEQLGSFWRASTSRYSIALRIPPALKCRKRAIGLILGLCHSIFRQCWATLGPPWGILGHLGAIFGPSWGHLGTITGQVGPSWGHLGASLGPSRAILGHLGGILGSSVAGVPWVNVCREFVNPFWIHCGAQNWSQNCQTLITRLVPFLHLFV
jgi:hypothetical protein